MDMRDIFWAIIADNTTVTLTESKPLLKPDWSELNRKSDPRWSQKD